MLTEEQQRRFDEEDESFFRTLGVEPARHLQSVSPGPDRSRWSSMVSGEEFVFGTDAILEPVWGSQERCAWAAGEGLMLFGPQGTGKTTLAQQLMKARLGLLDEVLGMPVTPDERRVLYIAGDRPRQAARSMRRSMPEDEATRSCLTERLRVWKGRPDGDIVKRPELLMELAEHAEAGTIFIDSLKDIASKLSDDETGSQVNQAIQLCMREGVQVVVLHHPRKNGNDQAAGGQLDVDKIYGSTFLTAGLGSIIGLQGKTGDAVVKLVHLKLINDEVGPFHVLHDHDRGVSSITEQFNVLDVVKGGGAEGLSAHEVAVRATGMAEPGRAAVEKQRRALAKLVSTGRLRPIAGAKGGANGGTATRYVLATSEGEPVTAS